LFKLINFNDVYILPHRIKVTELLNGLLFSDCGLRTTGSILTQLLIQI